MDGLKESLKKAQAQEILLRLGKHLDVWSFQDGEVGVSYENCELKDGMFLRGAYGTGRTFQEACEDYLTQIRGKTLVFRAYTSKREEIRVL